MAGHGVDDGVRARPYRQLPLLDSLAAALAQRFEMIAADLRGRELPEKPARGYRAGFSGNIVIMEDAGRMVLSAAGDLVVVAAFRTRTPC